MKKRTLLTAFLVLVTTLIANSAPAAQLTLGSANVLCDQLTVATGDTLVVADKTLDITGATDIDGTMTVSTGTVDADGAFDATGGDITFSDAGTLELGGAVTSLGTLSEDAGTVSYDKDGAQNVFADNYFNLTIAGSGTKTLGGTAVVLGNLDLDSELDFSGDVGRTLNLSGNADIDGTLTVSSTGQVYLGSFGNFDASGGSVTFTSSGILRLTGTVTSLGTFTEGSSTVIYAKDGAQNVMRDNYYNLTIDGGNTKTLTGATSVVHTLTLTNGRLSLGEHTLIMWPYATEIGGTLSASNMIVTGGTGGLQKMFYGRGSYTFPVGDTTGDAEYSPATLNFTSGTFAVGRATVQVTDAKQPDNTSTTNYLTRYWTVTSSGITGFSCNTTFTYVVADIVGTETSIHAGKYSDSTWTVGNAVDADNNQFSMNGVTSFSDFTGVNEGAAPTTQASEITFSDVTETTMTVGWTRGNGNEVLVVGHAGSAVESNPVDGTTYTANAAFGSGSQIGTGNYVVYKGAGTSVAVTGLTQNTTYYFRAYEIDTSGIPVTYNRDTAANNPNSQKTVEQATKVVLTGPATILKDGLGAFALTTKNTAGDVKNVSEDTVFNLTDNSAGTGTFYSNAAGTTSITQVQINSGTSTATVYYRDDTFGAPTLTATRASGQVLTAGTKQIGAKGNNALSFDGTDDYVKVDNGPNSVKTIEFWVYPDQVISQGLMTVGSGQWIDSSSGELETNVANPTYRVNGKVSTTIEANKWQHVSITTDTAIDVSNAFYIGYHYNVGSEVPFDGKMDEVRLWSDVRTEAEIRANMHRELQGNEAGLVAYYKLDTGAGSTAFDSSGNGYDGTLTGGPTWQTSGAMSGPGNALDFDGSDDYVQIPSSSTLTSGTFSVEFWMKMTGQTAWGGIIDHGAYDTAGDRYNWQFITVENEWQIKFGITKNEAGDWSELTANVTQNKWHHVAGIYDETTMSLYLDGVLIGTQETAIRTADKPIVIGKRVDAEQYFNGQLDEIRVWNIARTPAQIRDNMCKSMQGDESGLMACYRMDQQDGTSLYDLSPNANTGTLNNMEDADWVASTAFNTWIGATDTTWNSAANWSRPNHAPGPTDNVGIPDYCNDTGYPAGNDPTISDDPTATVNHFALATGAGSTLSSDLTATGNLLLNNAFDVGANIVTVAGTTLTTDTLTIGMGGALDCNGPYDASSGSTTFTGAGALKLASTHNLGTFTKSTGRVHFDGASVQTITGTFNPYTLIIENAAGVDASGAISLTVDNQLVVQTGTFTSKSDYHDVTIAAGATLALSGPITVSGDWSNSGTFTHNDHTVTFDGATEQRVASGGNFCGMTINNDLALQDALTATGTVNLASGKTIGTSRNVTFSGTTEGTGTFNASGGTVTYNRAGNQDVYGGIYNSVSFAEGGIKTLSGEATINNTLTFTNGLVSLGDNDLILGENATVAGTLNASNMIVTGGTGVLKKVFTGTGSFTFPLGDDTGTAEYSPATLNFTAGTFNSAWAGVNVTPEKQANIPGDDTSYLNRYWSVTQSGITGFTCATTFNYLPADVKGTESEIFGGQWDGSEWTIFNAVDADNNRFTATVSSFSDFTGLERQSPATQATSLGFSSVTQTQMTVSWTRGDGDNVLVLAHQGSAVDSDPVDGTDYTAGSVFASGSQIGTGNYVVYKGTGTSVTVTGLTASNTYHFRACEYNGSDSKTAYNKDAATGNPASKATLPVAPPAPTATAPTGMTATGFSARWNASAGATGYRLDVSTKSDFSSYVSGYQNKDVGNTTTGAVSGLSGGTTYYYRVRAYNTGGTSGNSNKISTITIPAAPVATAATSVTQTGFTANWNAAAGATKYYLDVSTKSDFSSYVSGYQNKDVGNTTSRAVTGISAGTAYYYRVRAYNAAGTSENSNRISTATGELPTKVTLTGPSTVNVNTVSAAFTITSRDKNNDPADVNQNTVFNLTARSTGTFYSDATGKLPITQATILNGNSTATFFYKDTASGTPTVNATRTSGMSLGSATHPITVQAGVVSGIVFDDLNGNGIQDAGEPGISNVTVKLNNSAGTVKTTTTNANGYYNFSSVSPGGYTVQETDPAGYTSTTSNTVSITVSAGGSASANFGDQSRGTVSGTVFEDLNGNGIQDRGESGIAGVTVKRLDSEGGELESTTTAADGGYSFTNVTSGNYKIWETDPAGYTSTTSNTVSISVPAGGSATANFGDQGQGTVSGSVYLDANGNGIQNADEPGINNVTVTLLDSQGSTEGTTTTGSDGTYSFSGITSGSYTARETDPAGFTSTTPNSVSVSVAAGGAASANFGDQEQGTVSGRVFDDRNGNGRQDTLEPGLSGVTVRLLEDNRAEVQSAKTDGDGGYQFENVAPGSYTVEETDPEGFTSTTSNSVSVSVATGGSASASFGDREQGTVSGKVFSDQNGNGVQDTAEPGIGGVTITLLDDRGSVSASQTTVGDGSYRFENVSAGAYSVEETDPEGYTSTTRNTVSVSVSSDGSAGASFGDREQGTLSGKVFKDQNGNGIQDTGEAGLGGVSVKLTKGGSTLETQSTSGDGSYTFSEVNAGTYVVAETDPEGYTSTTNNRVPVHVSATGAATANFGDQEAVSVWGKVFQDLNGNEIQDSGEPGLGGVTVRLSGGRTGNQTTTSGDGSYQFTGIAYGSYQVLETDPSGFISTSPNTVPVSINASGSAIANFGDQKAGTITGTVFDDLNDNGTQDPGENGIGQVRVSLLRDSRELSSTTTAGNGGYSFSNLSADTYTVEETDPEGYTSTTANSVSVTTGSAGATANFGDIADGTISGVVFNDTNGNGTQDPGEKGVGGVTVNLLDLNEKLLQSVVTAADGLYTFYNLAPGTYIVEETYPSGYTGTTTNRVTVTVGDVTVSERAGDTAKAANFGVLQQQCISGVVFNDLNGNGVQDSGEHGLGGVRIALQGGTASSLDTAGDGTYGFYNVDSGAYSVHETYPDGYTGTTPQTVSVTLSSDGAATANFGVVQGSAPDRVTLTGPASAPAAQVSAAFSLSSRNGNGDLSNVTSNTVFNLTSTSGSGSFYSDADGKTAVTRVTLENGTNTAEFYYKDSSMGTPTVTAARTSGMSLGSDTHSIRISSEPAARVSLDGPETMVARSVSTAFTLTSRDQFGNPSAVSANTTFTLSSTSAYKNRFYSDAAGTVKITEITIAGGASQATFYYWDSWTGIPTVKATWKSGGTDLGAAGHQVRVLDTAFIYVSLDGECGGMRPCYTTVQAAVNAAVSGNTIRIGQGSFAGDIVLNAPMDLTFDGCWNKSFTIQTAGTTFIRPPKVNQGSVKMLMLGIKPGK